MSKPKAGSGYSSQSYTSGGAGRAAAPKSYPICAPIKKELLNPVNTKVDPNDNTAKTKEKDQMVGLNDKFVAFIDKVQTLEQKNKVLDTRLKILLEQESYKGNIDDIVNKLKSDLERQIEGVARDRKKLEAELAKKQEELEQTRQGYEDEFQKKTELENDFVIAKKDVDEGNLAAVDKALELEELMGELDFLRHGYDEEVKELESQVQNETVVMRENNKRALDMDEIIASVKAQYAEVASRTREEAEQWNQKKMDDMVKNAGKHEQEVKEVKKDISEMHRLVQRLTGEMEALKKKKDSEEKEIEEAEVVGQKAVQQTRDNILQLEEALRRAKQDMARQVREYQELMNLKLALDIEIATYRKLLEGEEKRMDAHNRQSDVDSSSKQPRKKPLLQDPVASPTGKRLLVKVQVEEGRVVSQSSHYFDD